MASQNVELSVLRDALVKHGKLHDTAVEIAGAGVVVARGPARAVVLPEIAFATEPAIVRAEIDTAAGVLLLGEPPAILLDVLRRVMQTSDIYRAAQIEKERARFAEGWGWNEGRGAPEHAGEAGASVSASASAPWQNMGMKWTWQAGGWRLGWDSNNVEEWTGPAMWTDAVIS